MSHFCIKTKSKYSSRCFLSTVSNSSFLKKTQKFTPTALNWAIYEHLLSLWQIQGLNFPFQKRLTWNQRKGPKLFPPHFRRLHPLTVNGFTPSTLYLFSDSSKSFSFWMMTTMCFLTLRCLTVFIICNAVRVLSPWLPTRSRLFLTFMRKRTISFNSIDLHCNSVYWCPFPVAHWIEKIALNFVLLRICWQADIS